MIALLTEVPHEKQRYETCGDWENYPNVTVITASRLANPDHMFVLQCHELLEAYLCRKRGISQAAVDAFDIAYEAKRPAGDNSEPGDDPKAPYHREHTFATKIEKLIAKELGISWKEYEQVLYSLGSKS